MTGASVLSSVVNTVNTIIGSGVLVLPYALRAEGVFCGCVVILLAGLANGFGMIMQGVAAQFLPAGHATFFSVCKITYPRLSVVFDLAIFLQCFGVNISYLVLISDLMPLIFSFDGWSLDSMKNFYLFGSGVLIIPLCFMKRLDSLKYTSIIALLAIVYICLLIYGNFFLALINNWQNLPLDKVGEVSLWRPQGLRPFLKTLGIIVLAYTCPNQFSIIGELENPSIRRISIICYISMSITMLIFFTVSLAGYFTFGNVLNGNILLMYENSMYTQLGRGLLVLMVAFSFPLMFHPARISFNNIIHTIEADYLGRDAQLQLPLQQQQQEESHEEMNDLSPLLEAIIEESHHVPFPENKFYIFTVILLIVSYLSAYYLNSFELILSIVGSTGGVLICFVLPGCYGYKLVNNPSYEEKLLTNSPDEANNWIIKSNLIKKMSLGLVIWGIIVMFVCLYSILTE